MKEKYCFNCGQSLPQAAKFCPSCGIEQPPLDDSQQEAQINTELITDDNAQSQVQVGSVAATTDSQASEPVSGGDKIDNQESARTTKAPIFSVNTDQLKEELAELNFKDENKRYLQDFLANNLTLVLASFALVIFTFIIFNRAVGVIVALGLAGGIYVLAVKEKGKTSQLNDRIIQASQQGAKNLQEGQKSLQDQLASRHKQASNQVRSKHQTKSKQATKPWFIATIVASFLSMYGYIARGFQIFSTASLNDIITTTIESLNRLIDITSAGNHYFQSTRVADLLATAKLGRTALQVF
ncbi:hypothetical protein AWM75_03345 [Aerococcus urinaehominis]|uniref:Uncharacterized protein n=1 Tax=Aerococcus urinaehominis TaxID=128944 RepID=A0A0X8FL57_9LACT|nr:zinc ribbon domain-containing protein [Aerococcus urinaehominis]AMB99094.1 hypothetical protein AWM75_03345 [Aerococcus urinaehominis]SDM03433.1 hypothetical protein SAMN04487985_10427 [Aerococcus urinaehominis]